MRVHRLGVAIREKVGRMLLGLLLLGMIFTSTSRAQSNVYQKWAATYVANPAGLPVAEVPDGLGNVYVTGSIVSEGVTVKYDSKGNTLWRAFLTASPANDPFTTGAQASGLAIGLDAAGNVYVLYEILIPNSPAAGPPIIATAKYNSAGVRQWVEYISSTFTVQQALTPSLLSINSYFPTGLAVSPNGDVYTSFFQTTRSNPNASSANLVKYNTNGMQQWLKTAAPAPFNLNTPEAVRLDGSENAYLLVNSLNNVNPPVPQDHVSEIFKFDPNGNIVATFGSDKLGTVSGAPSVFGAIGGIPSAVPFRVDAQGNSYVGSGGTPNETGLQSRIVAKFSTSGAVDWLFTFGLPFQRDNSNVGINDLAVDANGNVFVAQTADVKGASPAGSEGTDISVTKFNSTGQLQWTSNYNGHSDGSGFDQAGALALGSSGSFYVTGISDGTVQSSVGVRSVLPTIKFDAEGNQVWAERYQPNPAIAYGPAAAIAVSGSDVFVTGVGGVITPPSQSPNPQWLTINYGQDAAEVNPASLTFGAQAAGAESTSQTVTLTNITSVPFVIKTMNFSGPFHLTENCPDTVAPGASCSIVVTFRPVAAVSATGTITIRDTSAGNAIAPETIHLTGTGTN